MHKFLYFESIYMMHGKMVETDGQRIKNHIKIRKYWLEGEWLNINNEGEKNA